eukprot:1564955-Pyramimonas_sp.AAC.1
MSQANQPLEPCLRRTNPLHHASASGKPTPCTMSQANHPFCIVQARNTTLEAAMHLSSSLEFAEQAVQSKEVKVREALDVD